MRRALSIAVTVGVAAGALATAPLISANAASAGDPFAMTTGLYVNPSSPSARWVAADPDHADAAAIRAKISTVPMARWFTGTSDAQIGPAVAAYTGTAADAGDKLPVLVAYNLPGRDACGGESSGGAADAAAYHQWISTFAAAIGDRPAIVIIEPDSLGDFECMTPAQITERNSLLTFAGRMFAEKAPNTWAYLDAANPNWVAPTVVAKRLKAAGLSRVRGFAVNVSNYVDTDRATQYASQIRDHLGTGTPYVIDTSRNGNGYDGQWCNPAGRRLGARSTADPAALHLWIKNPGNSDGACGIAPSTPAGVFDPALAVRLINGR
ncbi:glycoside hydrolase family 6 protein [Catenuloplanes atrovinosus]|uniref:Glucanase n=1 Tax=Catenuloplanes atrovinosus TaxID=137266 RepID=A0AAE4CBW1_9ACTN|nr:glycoside hydrolase family 6 protein [Catenuloplanes atrovinosus]MDR7277349.1 endoglucanase [Catenuloplanes atrovinosus]